ncbi:MAG: YhbY family RNA-binding protein [archaeon GBS-70-058]|nr:YhbY family RNA-binding protein [Candidatus Culexarchaeum nevadense]
MGINKRKIKSLIIRNEIPKINVGRSGLTEAVMREIDRQLDEHEVVKIKLLKNSPLIEEVKMKELAKEIALSLKAEVMDVRGRTITLYRRQKSK